MGILNKFDKDVHSQNGEDGIIKEITKRLGIKRGWFCEFGVWDGKHLSNTFELAYEGWSGVLIEGDRKRFEKLAENLKKTQQKNQKLIPICAFVKSSGQFSLANILSQTPIPRDFDVLSIDIDSYDYWIWKYFEKYKPKIVVIEVNSYFKPGEEYIQPDNTNGKKPEGTSFSPMLLLGTEKGYKLVCHTGNMIFVRRDLINRLGLPNKELLYPNSLFTDPKLTVAKCLFRIKNWKLIRK